MSISSQGLEAPITPVRGKDPAVGAPTLRPWTRHDWVACLVSTLVGLLLAAAPHLATWARYGTPEFLADNDDVYYMAISRAPYYGEGVMRDAYAGRREKVFDLHAWAQFGPPAEWASAVGLPLIDLGLAWRVVGGAMFGLALYLLFRRLFAWLAWPTAWSLGCALVCLADGGFSGGRSFLHDFLLVPHFFRGTTPLTKPDAIPQYRVVTPLLNLPFLLMLAYSLVPGGRGRWRDMAIGAVCLGACVLLYFYYWTAAVVLLGGVLGVQLLRAAWRPEARGAALSRAGVAAAILAGGLAIGGPQIYQNTKAFNNPQVKPFLERAGRGAHVAKDDPIRWRFLFNVWAWGKLAIGACALLALRSPGLGLLWGMTLVGFGLTNSALVTGLEFENSHWFYVSATFGEIMLLLIVATTLDRRACPGWLRAAWVVPLALLALAAAWRPYEALHAPEAVWNNRVLEDVRPLRRTLAALDVDRTLAGSREAQVALLYSRCGLLFHEPYTPMTMMPLAQAHQRHALNAWLQGMDLGSYARQARPARGLGTIYSPPECQPEAVERDRLAIFRSLMDHPGLAASLIDRFSVAYLLLPATAPTPSRGGPWSLIDQDGAFALWAREPLPKAPGTARDGTAVSCADPAASHDSPRSRR